MPSSNDSGSSSDNSAIIGGAAGGVILLLMITIVLCVAIVCVRRSHRKETFPMGYDEAFYIATKLNTAVTTQHNPSYDVTKTNTVDHLYIACTGSDVPVSPKPSCNVVTEFYSKTNEDEYNYVQPNELNQHSDLGGTIKMDTNPSYGVSRGEDTSAFSETVTKSDTKAHQSSHNATTEQYDYVRGDFLHQNTATNTTRNTDVQIYTTVDQSHNTKLSHSPYLSLIANSARPTDEHDTNKPQSYDPNNKL